MTKCLDCGCTTQGGICSNCQEELFIFEYQNDDIATTVSDEFANKIKEQRRYLKRREL